ncbi:MAG: LPXTG cell wall anchor domain-containing protein, partial [Oscillospiraceae bacterium]|nr:LPXTG cell wall anchor domain-containing protein [Oscillospiraceae bacterium]
PESTAEPSPVPTEVTQIVYSALTELPEGLAEQYESVEELREDMIAKVVASDAGYTGENAVVYEITLQISTDGGQTWVYATEENFPADGILVTLDYPEGTDSSYDFVVAHTFTMTSDRLGTVAGETEYPAVTKTDTGISFRLTGLSPVSIAWKEGAAATAAPTASAAATSAAPNTGDSANTVLWAALMILCMGGIAALTAAVRRRRKN